MQIKCFRHRVSTNTCAINCKFYGKDVENFSHNTRFSVHINIVGSAKCEHAEHADIATNTYAFSLYYMCA